MQFSPILLFVTTFSDQGAQQRLSWDEAQEVLRRVTASRTEHDDRSRGPSIREMATELSVPESEIWGILVEMRGAQHVCRRFRRQRLFDTSGMLSLLITACVLLVVLIFSSLRSRSTGFGPQPPGASADGFQTATSIPDWPGPGVIVVEAQPKSTFNAEPIPGTVTVDSGQ